MEEKATQEPTLVTSQPETLILNKYMGFKQLSYIQEKGISCIIPNEIEKIKEDFWCRVSNDNLWSIRVATITGRDFDLPSIIGVDKSTAFDWIVAQKNTNPNFLFFYSEYFKPIISGRIHMQYFNTKIEMSLGDFDFFKHNVPELSIISSFGQSFERKIDKHLIDEIYIEQTISLSKRLRTLYGKEFISDLNLLHEYDFAFIQNGAEIELQIIGMRAYIDKNIKYGKISPLLLRYLMESYRDNLFEVD